MDADREFSVTAGGSLHAAKELHVDSRGKKLAIDAEKRTARILDDMRFGQYLVLNDLMLPVGQYTVNVDHIVLYGDKVQVLDTKVWKEGFYWTFRGKTRRGKELVPVLDKQTIPMIVDHLRSYLVGKDLSFVIVKPLIVVWPSKKKPATFLYRPPAGKVIPGSALNSQCLINFSEGITQSTRKNYDALRHLLFKG